jgi:hypothetical protein
MARRLPSDANLVGYWGLDEASVTDDAIDGSLFSRPLSVTSAVGVGSGRVAGAREFNGTSSFASRTDAGLRLTGDSTFMAWVYLDEYNSSGSFLRAIVANDGPLISDDVNYALFITNLGAVQYRHTSSSGEVVVSSPNGVVRTRQFYSIAVRRVTSGGDQTIEILLDNRLLTATATVAGTPTAQPLPPPVGNASAVFSVGRALSASDAAYWDGMVDEISVHDVARPEQAYLRAAYFSAALRSATTKLTVTDNVLSVAASDMGNGVRWWCINRSRELYVVKESPFGFFGPETRLTTVSNENTSNVVAPELVYDAPNDTLYIFFIASNRVYRLTANSTDAPGTINMPLTADVGNQMKLVDFADGGRISDGGAERVPREEDFVYVNRSPIKLNLVEETTPAIHDGGGGFEVISLYAVNVAFIVRPDGGFGIHIGYDRDRFSGVRVYDVTGGAAVYLGNATLKRSDTLAPVWFYALGTRTYGSRYVMEAITRNGAPSGVFSTVLVDRLNRFDTYGYEYWGMGSDGDGWDYGTISDGGADRAPREEDFVYINRAPLKLSAADPDTNYISDGGGGEVGSITQSGLTVNL